MNRPKMFKLAFYGPDWWSVMDELAIQPGQYFALTLVRIGKFRLMACENYASYVLQNSNCHIGQETDYNLERIGWYCNWRWHTNHGDERIAFYIKLTSDVLIFGQIMNVPAVILVFRVTGSACSLIHATAWIQAWGKPVWTGVDDVLLLAPVLKHVVPSLLA
ncbi:hypothetical protein Tco_1380094 [Tanacetum coccineum]